MIYQEKIKLNTETFQITISKENEKEIKCNIKQIEIFPQIEYELIINFNELKKNHKLISFFPDINLFISFIIEKKNIRIEKKNENEINLIIKATMENLNNVEIKIPKIKLNNEKIISLLIEKILNLEKVINKLTENLNETNEKIIELKRENLELKKELNEKANYILYDTLEDEEKKINQILLLPNGNFISVSFSKKIKFYHGKNKKLFFSIENAHEESITNICLIDNNHIATCSRDKSIKIWFIDIPKNYLLIEHIKNAHEDRILNIIYTSNKQLISCSSDKSIKIWNQTKGNEYLFQNIIKIIADTNYIESIIELNNNIFVSGGKNGIKFWDSKTFECKFHFDKAFCLCWNSIFKINNDEILTWGKIERKIYRISFSKKKIISENICDGNLKTIFVNSDNFVFTGCDDMKIRIYTLDKLKLVNIINVNQLFNIYDDDGNILSSKILGFVELNDKSIICFGRACENGIYMKDKFQLNLI